MILVDTDAICAAIKDVFEETRSILEPAGALAIAGAKAWVARHRARDRDAGRDRLRRQHQLRPAALRRRAGRGGRAARGDPGGDHPGAARQLQALLRRHRAPQHHRVQLPDGRSRAWRTSSSGSRCRTGRRPGGSPAPCARRGFRTLDLSGNEMAKLHVRHLVGGHAPARQPRAALSLRVSRAARRAACASSTAMRSDWNISLFHYRNHGADYGRVLVGMQVPPGEMRAFRRFLTAAGVSVGGRDAGTRPIGCSWA